MRVLLCVLFLFSVSFSHSVGLFPVSLEVSAAHFSQHAPDMSHCECEGFLEKMKELANEVNEARKTEKTAKKNEEIHAEIGDITTHVRSRCTSVFSSSISIQACIDSDEIYGIENIPSVISSAPGLMCELLTSCGEMISDDDLANGGIAAIIAHQITQDDAIFSSHSTDFPTDFSAKSSAKESKAFSEKDIDILVSSDPVSGLEVNAAAMEQQQMLEGQRLREQELREMDTLLNQQVQQKLLAAQERNRALRENISHLMKVEYRSRPGHCDCCDACLPPDATTP